MNIGRAAYPIAQQIAINVANAGLAVSGTAVDAYKEMLRHQ